MAGNANGFSATTSPGEARLLAVSGNRIAAVYAAHTRMEESLARLPAVLADTTRYQPSTVDPWAAVSATVDSLSGDVELCLQLFSAGVQVERSRGLPTVALLYGQQESASSRLLSFATAVRGCFSSDQISIPVPAHLVLRFAEAMRPLDGALAVEWLRSGLEDMLETKRVVEKVSNAEVAFGQTSGVPESMRTMQGTKGVVITMLTLLIRWHAELGVAGLWVRERREELSLLVDEHVLVSFVGFEAESATVMLRKRHRLQKQAERRSAKKQVKTNPPAGEVPGLSVEPAASSDTTPILSQLRMYVSNILTTDWNRSQSRAAFVFVALVLLCILARRTVSTASTLGFFSGGASRGGKKMISF